VTDADGENTKPLEPDSDGNPYQSPKTDCGTNAQAGIDRSDNTWLVRASVGLAIFIEVLPTEVDITVAALGSHQLMMCILAKVICVSVILAPLLAYIGLNGWQGLKAVQGKVSIISTIVFLRLLMDGYMLIRYLERGSPY
jgi:hypothetical protein